MKDKIYVSSYRQNLASPDETRNRSIKTVGLFIAAAVTAGIIYTVYYDDNDCQSTTGGSSGHGFYRSSNGASASEGSGTATHGESISTGVRGGLGSAFAGGLE